MCLISQVIPTDKVPVSVHYIEHLDQVWVLCWNGETGGGSKTVVVIRQASEDMQHHTVHTQPIANRFDLVSVPRFLMNYSRRDLSKTVQWTWNLVDKMDNTQ